MGIALNWFQLDYSWSCLFERLPNWFPTGRNVWTDGWTTVNLATLRHGQPLIGFTSNKAGTLSALAAGPIDSDLPLEGRITDVMSPAGIPVRFKTIERAKIMSLEKFTLRMNHVSVNVKNLDQERLWYERMLGPSVVLARDKAWEPVSGSFVHDAHLFSPPWFYVTIRESNQAPNVDHVGWMANDVETVCRLGDIVNDLRWKIVYGPAEIDGSFLIHFEGPDGNVHDFFCPLEDLQKRVRPNNERY